MVFAGEHMKVDWLANTSAAMKVEKMDNAVVEKLAPIVAVLLVASKDAF